MNAGTLSPRMRDLEINRIMAGGRMRHLEINRIMGEGRMIRFGNQKDPREEGLNPKPQSDGRWRWEKKDICRNHEALQTEAEKEEGKFGNQQILYTYCTLVIFTILWWATTLPPDHSMLANCARVGTELLLFPKLDCPQRMGVQMENLKIE